MVFRWWFLGFPLALNVYRSAHLPSYFPLASISPSPESRAEEPLLRDCVLEFEPRNCQQLRCYTRPLLRDCVLFRAAQQLRCYPGVCVVVLPVCSANGRLLSVGARFLEQSQHTIEAVWVFQEGNDFSTVGIDLCCSRTIIYSGEHLQICGAYSLKESAVTIVITQFSIGPLYCCLPFPFRVC